MSTVGIYGSREVDRFDEESMQVTFREQAEHNRRNVIAAHLAKQEENARKARLKEMEESICPECLGVNGEHKPLCGIRAKHEIGD